jgi:hypothetical protein
VWAVRVDGLWIENALIGWCIVAEARSDRETLARRRAGPLERYDDGMATRPANSPPGSTVVVTNPDEDCSPEAFRAFLDELLAGPDPELESLEAAEALQELRVDTGA